MKNKLLIPLIVVSMVGLIVGSSVGGVLIVKQVKYSQLSTLYDELTGDFDNQLELYENITADYENQLELYESIVANYENLLIEMEQLSETYQDLLITYNILVGDNSDLQDDYDALLADYNLLVINYNSLYASYINLQNFYNDLQDDYNNLQISYDGLQSDYNNLQSDYDGLTDDFNNLQTAYDDLSVLYGELQSDYTTLQSNYNALQIDYDLLSADYTTLLDEYNDLYLLQQTTQNSLDLFLDMIINEIPMAQKMALYYQFVRNNEEQNIDWMYGWNEVYQFEEKIILHASGQYNDAFSEVDTILENYNFFDISSYNDIWSTMVNVYGANSEGGFVPDDFFMQTATLQQIQTWMTDNLHYIYDSDTEWNRAWIIDFIQSPLETMMYSGGDCEDWTIFASTFFEVSGFETAVAGIHDDNHGLFGSFSHSFLFVKVGSNYPSTIHWHLPYGGDGYPWIPVDTLWCDIIGDVPTWLQWYYDFGDATWIEDHIDFEIVDGIFD